jgi:hypothetical protein
MRRLVKGKRDEYNGQGEQKAYQYASYITACQDVKQHSLPP